MGALIRYVAMKASTPLIPVLMGQTASGKSSVGILLAHLLNGEIISMDSRKIYADLPIGTATPRGRWEGETFFVDGVAHHLMGHLPPDRVYTAGDFSRDADHIIEAILNRGRTPILVGGTGFYFKSLQDGLPALPVRDDALRRELHRRLLAEGTPALHNELKRLDPAAAGALSPNDKQKIIRALEVCRLSGKPYSDFKRSEKSASRWRYAVMALRWPKPLLEERIERRSRAMMDDGMIEETEAVLKKGYPPTCPALISFGYREAVMVIQGKISRDEFLPLLIRGTKAYAKRQLTWLRTQTKCAWHECDAKTEKNEIALNMKAFLENISNGLIYSAS